LQVWLGAVFRREHQDNDRDRLRVNGAKINSFTCDSNSIMRYVIEVPPPALAPEAKAVTGQNKQLKITE